MMRRANNVHACPALPARVRGFSLIEVLVAVLIVAVGVLGIVGMQGVTMRTNTGAMMRAQATQYAYNIIDRARANPGADYRRPALAAGVSPFVSLCEANPCSVQAMANDDIALWLSDVAQLPTGRGRITVTPTVPAGGNIIKVTVQWVDQRVEVEEPDLCRDAGHPRSPICVTVGTQIKIPAP